jgi:NADH-quinone oxidoreductase subunit I
MVKLFTETLRNFFKKPVTYKFPLEARPASPDFRGMQVVDIKKCISCRLCALDCPADAIEMALNRETKKEYPVVDFGRCVFCYQCVRVCPVSAYVTSNKYDLATFDKKTLIKDVLNPDTQKQNGGK